MRGAPPPCSVRMRRLGKGRGVPIIIGESLSSAYGERRKVWAFEDQTQTDYVIYVLST